MNTNTKMMSKEQRIASVLDEMERHGYWADAVCAERVWSSGRPYYTTNFTEHGLIYDVGEINAIVQKEAV